MKKVLIAMLGGAAMSVASLAQAADLPYRNGEPASGYDYPPSFTWTGFYAGLNTGGGVASFSNGGSTYFGSNPWGWMIGGTAGFNFQSGNLLVGVEGDYDWSSFSSSTSPWIGIASSGNINSIATVRGRVGYAMDRILFYGTGGYAGADIGGTLNNFNWRAIANQSFWANGFALGLGAEYAFTPHITGKAEYLYTSFGNNTYFSGTPNVMNAGASVNLLRAGVNYKF